MKFLRRKRTEVGGVTHHAKAINGYEGQGPAQLALALLADCLGQDGVALRLHPEFKWAIVANFPSDA